MKRLIPLLAILLVALACARKEPLTPEKAEAIVRASMFASEPVYAEVPQTVTYGPKSPKDDFDELSVRTLRNLERAGLVTVTETEEPDGTVSHRAKVTEKGFTILGTMPSARGPAFRGRIARKTIKGLRDFERHPQDPSIARAEVVWAYVDPTPLYPLFDTKINKPVNEDFVSIVSFHWDKGWKFDITVPKVKASEAADEASGPARP